MNNKNIEQAIGSCPKFIVSQQQTGTMLPSSEGAWVHIQDVNALLRKLSQEPECETCGGSGGIPTGVAEDGRSLQETNAPEVIEPCPACSQPPIEELKGHTRDCSFTLDGCACTCGYRKAPTVEEKTCSDCGEYFCKANSHILCGNWKPEIVEPAKPKHITPKPETHLRPSVGKCTECFDRLFIPGGCPKCGATGKEPKATPKPETTLTPVINKCTECEGHSRIIGHCDHCGGSGWEPKAENFEQWFTMEGQNIIGHYDGQEESLCKLVWEARQEEITEAKQDAEAFENSLRQKKAAFDGCRAECKQLQDTNHSQAEELTHLKRALGE